MEEVSEKFKEWWRKYDDSERCRLIKEKAIEVEKLYKRMIKANEASLKYGFNRKGIRGGRFTTLEATCDKAAKVYVDTINDLKYMIATL